MTDVPAGLRPPCWCPSRWAPAWCLHTNLHKFGENVYPHIFHKKNCCDLNLGESICIFAFFFSDSGLNILNSFDFSFWRDTENQQFISRELFFYLSKNHSFIHTGLLLYFKLSSILMFDVYNNTAPHNISHLFIPTQQIHSYRTRSSSSGNYYISHSRLNQKNDSFSIMGAKIWKSIPENLRNSSKSLFKEKVHATLLKTFEVQDRYADLNTIISDFKNY